MSTISTGAATLAAQMLSLDKAGQKASVETAIFKAALDNQALVAQQVARMLGKGVNLDITG